MIKFIILFIIYLLFKIGFIGKLVYTIIPFIMGFGLAYMLYPIELKLSKKLPKLVSIIIIVISILLFILLIINIIIPTIIKEGPNLISTIISYINNISIKYNINILTKISNINYNHILNGISISINLISNIIISFISFIYFLIYMDNIKDSLSHFKIYNYLSYLNNDFSKYVTSLFKISIISFFEYIVAFKIIGYPNPILIGVIASILNMIPYIGGIITVFITIILCPSMIIKISILYIILGLIEGYIITPYVYGKYNKVNPLIGLLSLSIGSSLGFIGMILSFPILIIILSTINYIKENNIKISVLK